MGCSTFEPVVQRAYNPEAQMLNRRVEVDSTTTLVTDLQEKTRAMPASPAQPASPTGSEAGHGDASHGSGHDAGHDAGH